MFYGHAAELAIRATLYMAGRPSGEHSTVRDVAKATSLPSAYLSKVIQRLAQAGLVRTYRGPGGGIELAHPPEAITLWALVRATDGSADINRCALGIGNCSSTDPCPLHNRWAPLREEFQKLLEGTTVAALRQELRKGRGDDRPTGGVPPPHSGAALFGKLIRKRQDQS